MDKMMTKSKTLFLRGMVPANDWIASPYLWLQITPESLASLQDLESYHSVFTEYPDIDAIVLQCPMELRPSLCLDSDNNIVNAIQAELDRLSRDDQYPFVVTRDLAELVNDYYASPYSQIHISGNDGGMAGIHFVVYPDYGEYDNETVETQWISLQALLKRLYQVISREQV